MGALRIAFLAGLVLLAACVADERAKPLGLDKGTYRGPADSELSDATRRLLAQRLALQRFEGALSQPLRPDTPPPAPAAVEGRIAGQRF